MVKVSIIIVNYKVREELFSCLDSIRKSKTKVKYEVIVVDNDEEKTLGKELSKKYSEVVYVPSRKNLGFGGGNNLGAEKAKGEFLFFLNPDTEIQPGAVDILIKHLEKNTKTAIVAPVLLDEGKNIIPLQGAKTLTPIRATLSFSILARLYPKNKVANEFWINSWDRKTTKKVETVPGTAFVIRKKIFDEVKGFDDKFFLYFEEYDLCKRVCSIGKEIYLIPKAKLIHKMGRSTGKSNREYINKIFERSRFYYFKKNFGIIKAFLVWLVFSLNKKSLILLGILSLGAFLRFHRLSELMAFIGDQGWFYLSARDLVLGKSFPLVGIASSHPWLHQGPLWIYLLAPVLWIGKFNPVSGAYLSGIIGTGTIILIYQFCKDNFSQRIAFLSAFFFAASPFIVINDRTPYHTSPIPFFTILYLIFLTKWVKGNYKFFPLVLFSVSVLYSFEIATLILSSSLVFLLLYGFYKKKEWFLKTMKKNIIAFSVLLFFIPLLPVLIYDFRNGFPQTLKFSAWLIYRGLILVGVLQKSSLENSSFAQAFFYFLDTYNKLVFIPNFYASLIILFSSLLFGIMKVFLYFKKKDENIAFVVVFLTTLVSIVGFIVNKVPSGAYTPVMYPGIVILFAFLVESLFRKWKSLAIFFVFFVVFSNINFILKSNFLTSKKTNTYSATIQERLKVSRQVVEKARGKKYSLKMLGPNGKFESYSMNYEYIGWWLGNEPAKTQQKLLFSIDETAHGIVLKESMLR